MCKRRWLFHQKYLIQLKYAFYWFDVAAAEAAAVTAKAADEYGVGLTLLVFITLAHELQQIYAYIRRYMDEYEGRLYLSFFLAFSLGRLHSFKVDE